MRAQQLSVVVLEHLNPAQRARLAPNEIASKLSGEHAESTILNAAQQNGLTPSALGVTRTICPECEAAIRASGVR
jgi:hypothetical protein